MAHQVGVDLNGHFVRALGLDLCVYILDIVQQPGQDADGDDTN